MTESHRARYDEFKAFVRTSVTPLAGRWDQEQALPADVIAQMGSSGYLGARIPAEYGGRGWDTVTFGLLNEAFGRGSSALTDVITVQAMVSMALLKWGSADQRRTWLPRLAAGDTIAAFALTEPGVGSDMQSLATTFTATADGVVLNGAKKWISCAQFAGVFLVFGMLDGQPLACLVPRTAPGLEIEPIADLMGFRAAGLGQLRFRDVHVPASDVVGKPGFALSHVAAVGLHYGRISTACSALGLLRGCVEESISYAATRRIGERTVGDLGMIRSLLTRMGCDLEAATLLCESACSADDQRLPETFEKVLIAKYFASRAAVQAAGDAVQIHGAAGCHGAAPVSRFYRDAKVMEIIEGTTQIHEDLLGKIFVDQAGRLQARSQQG
ncbi:MAG: acyl-CoA dehydrogenase family protein [Vicinamibacterales bacterium]